MSPSPDPETLLRELSNERVPLEAAVATAARRERVIDALGRAIREVPRARERRAQRLRWASVLAVAAVVVLGLGLGSFGLLRRAPEVAEASPNIGSVQAVSGTLVLTQHGRSRVVSQGENPGLAAGDAISTAPDGSARLRTERSVTDVAPATKLRLNGVSPAEERLHLAIGRIQLNVEPRPDVRRTVVVETPDAEVVVHGTVFSVAVDSRGGVEVTRVRVDEGAVSVLHRGERVLITGGQEWSSAAKPKPAAEPSAEPAAEPRVEARRALRTKAPSRRAAAPPADASTLAEENRLFLTAVEARNRGDDRAAVELFGAMLAKYPSGKLAEEARIERMRALNRLGESAKAAAEARRYLARHATGFARDEARSTALDDSASRSDAD